MKNMQEVISSPKENQDSKILDSLFNEIELISIEINNYGIEFEFNKDDLLDSEDKESLLEKLKELRKNLLEAKSKIKDNNKLKKRIGKICYKKLEFLDNISSSFKIFLLSIFLALTSLGGVNADDIKGAYPLITSEEIGENDELLVGNIDHDLYKDYIRNSYTYGTSLYTEYNYNGIVVFEEADVSSGAIMRKTIAVDKDGLNLSAYYDASGNLVDIFKTKYIIDQNGKYNYEYSYSKSFYSNGSLKRESSCVENDAYYIDYDESGKVSNILKFVNHTYTEEQKYNKDGTLIFEYKFIDSVGISKQFYDNGSEKLYSETVDGKYVVLKTYNEFGLIIEDLSIDENGDTIEIQYKYNDSGKLIQCNEFKNGYFYSAKKYKDGVEIVLKEKELKNSEFNTYYSSDGSYCTEEIADGMKILKYYDIDGVKKEEVRIYKTEGDEKVIINTNEDGAVSISLYKDSALSSILLLYKNNEHFKNAIDSVSDNSLILDLYISANEFIALLTSEDENMKFLKSKINVDLLVYDSCTNYNMYSMTKDVDHETKAKLYNILNKYISENNCGLTKEDITNYYSGQILLSMDESNRTINFDYIKSYLQNNAQDFLKDRDLKIDVLKKLDFIMYLFYNKKGMSLGGLLSLDDNKINFEKFNPENFFSSLDDLNDTNPEDLLENLYDYYNYKKTKDVGVCSNIAVTTALLANAIGFKSFVASSNTHIVTIIQDEGYINVITWGKEGIPSHKKISIDELSNKIEDLTGIINLYEFSLADERGNIVAKKYSPGIGSLIDKLTNQVEIDGFVDRDLSPELVLPEGFEGKFVKSELDINSSSKVVYVKSADKIDLLKSFQEVGYVNLFNLSNFERTGFGADILSSTFIYEALMDKRSSRVSNITEDLKTKISLKLFSKEDIFNILNINLVTGFIGHLQTQLPFSDTSGFSVLPGNAEIGMFGKMGADLDIGLAHILLDGSFMSKDSLLKRVDKLSLKDLFYREYISTGQASISTSNLDLGIKWGGDFQKALDIHELTFSALIRSGKVKENSDEYGRVSYSINVEQLTPYGQELMPMIKPTVIKDKAQLEVAMKEFGGRFNIQLEGIMRGEFNNCFISFDINM